MKRLSYLKIAVVFFAGLAFACKKNQTAPADNFDNEIDTTETMLDTVSPVTDTSDINTSTTGTTGATGKSSTGSGSAGTTEKGNSNVRTDSTSNP